MDAALAAAIAVLFYAGVHAMVRRDLIRVAIGVTLISYGVDLFIIAGGLSRGRAPIHPLPEGAAVSDPLVQALVLTAIVISAGTTAVMIGLIYRAYAACGSLDQQAVRGSDRAGQETT